MSKYVCLSARSQSQSSDSPDEFGICSQTSAPDSDGERSPRSPRLPDLPEAYLPFGCPASEEGFLDSFLQEEKGDGRFLPSPEPRRDREPQEEARGRRDDQVYGRVRGQGRSPAERHPDQDAPPPPAKGQQVTGWCFTWFHYPRCFDDERLESHRTEYFQSLAQQGVKRIVFQVEECPKTERKHVQGYVVFKRSQRLRNVTSLFPGAHCEPRLGSEGQAVAYCEKEETRIGGPWYYPGYDSFSRESKTKPNAALLDMRRAILSGVPLRRAGMEEESFGAFVRHHRALSAIEEDQTHQRRPREHAPLVLTITGKPGVGKSTLAWRVADAFRVKDEREVYYVANFERYMHGYQKEKIVIIDEFNHRKVPLQTFNSLCDRFPVSVFCFQRMCSFAADLIIVVSNDDIDEWYRDEEHRRSCVRRISYSVRDIPCSPAPVRGYSDEAVKKIVDALKAMPSNFA